MGAGGAVRFVGAASNGAANAQVSGRQQTRQFDGGVVSAIHHQRAAIYHGAGRTDSRGG